MNQESKASQFVRQLKEYRITSQECWKVPDNSHLIKADWNESGQAPTPLVAKRLTAFISGQPLHWYPDVEATELRKHISAYVDLPFEFTQVFNGSDSALEYIARAFIDAGDEVIIRVPTYDNFRVYVESCGATVKTAMSKSAFKLDWQTVLDEITPKTKLVYLVNPDNPTGITYSHKQIKEIATKAEHAIIIIDEAYFEFYGETAAQLIKSHPNIIVSRSFSKAFALAGVRCGYILADPEILGVINKIRVGKNVNSFAQIAAIAALEDITYVHAYVTEVKETKKWLLSELKRIEVEALDTPANFINIQIDNPTELVSHLRNNGVYVRDRSYFPQLQRSVRITVGTKAQGKRLIELIEEYLELRLFFDDTTGGM